MSKILVVVDSIKVGDRTIAIVEDSRTGEEYFFFDGGTVCGPFDKPEPATGGAE